jgi:hypothetical protein
MIMRCLSINDKPVVPVTDYVGYLSRTQGASSAQQSQQPSSNIAQPALYVL